MKRIIFPIFLAMFDGAASGAGAAGAGDGTGGSTSGPASTQQDTKTGAPKVLYGKQPETPASAGDNTEPAAVKQESPDAGGKDRSAQFKDLISGEYKDLYDAEIQRIIGRRFKETKGYQETIDAQKPILDQLSHKYGTKPGDVVALQAAIDNDDSLWSSAAEAAGMDVGQYKQVQRLERENAQLRAGQEDVLRQQRADQQMQKWIKQADELKAQYKDFDLRQEIQNPDFLQLLQSGVSVGHAYSVMHLDEITKNAATSAAAQTEKAVTANIRARGARPTENGASAQSGVVIKDDPSKWTKADLNEVMKRVARGEQITL